MSYVPIVPPTPTPPSPRVRDLADQLSQVIAEFERTHSAMSNSEVRQATQLAVRGRGASGPGAVPILIVLTLAVGIAVFFFFAVGG